MLFGVEQVDALLQAKEGENLEFKEAKSSYSFTDLAKYGCALANEGGGMVVLGVTNKRPRRVVGTRAFEQPEDVRRKLVGTLHLAIDFSETAHPGGRVLIFHVPGRPLGRPIRFNGIYWSREADSLVPLPESRLFLILAEGGQDFSAEACPGARLEDLDPDAIEIFRRLWMEKSKNGMLANLTREQVVRDVEAVIGDGVTFAGLILFGTRQALGKHLGQAEFIFEYRPTMSTGPAQERKEFRQGFFSYYEELWRLVNLRNDLQHYHDGLFVLEIPTFDEISVREAYLNAASHRDYRLGGSVFIRQYSRQIAIESPGGLPRGITPDNILYLQAPRNRRIAEIFARCGLVERSGQGMNLMFERSIRQGKSLPDLAGTDDFFVVVTLHGHIQDPQFIQFLEKLGQDRLQAFSTQDFLVLDLVHRERNVPTHLIPRARLLTEIGALEPVSRGRYILGRPYFVLTGRTGAYTRMKGISRPNRKALLLKHIEDNSASGSRLEDLMGVLPDQGRSQVQVLLRELRREGRIEVVGRTRAARWHPRKPRPE